MNSKAHRIRRKEKRLFARNLRAKLAERQALNKARILEMFGYM